MNVPGVYLKPINELLSDAEGRPARFWIPAYQRGYRWKPLQVTQLLDDIWEFIQNSENSSRQAFYCLQPLVIKARPGGDYEVVDGQQRLTSIYIILTYLKEMVAMLGKSRFEIRFETRGAKNEPFLADIDLSRATENIDFFHISEAYLAVQEWFSGRDQMHKLKFLQHLLNDDEVGHNVKVIWFQLSEYESPVDAFTRLNVGKIPLTNDELIRASFLRRSAPGESDEQSARLRIAYEWDQLEKSLQSDSFWYFLSNAPGKDHNRIGFLFDLVARAEGVPDEALHDEYGVFYVFSQKLKAEDASAEHEWRKVKQAYLTLEEWFEDRTLYHLVGFLVNEGMCIEDIKSLSCGRSKSSFERSLREEIFRRIVGGELPSPENGVSVKERVEDSLEELNYRVHGKKIKSILLLLNLATLLQSRRSNMRFQFDSFKEEQWDIEHIRSVSSDKPENYAKRKQWLCHCLNYLEFTGDAEGMRSEISDFLALPQKEASNDRFDPLYQQILEYFKENDEDDADHSIANLTLLDWHTNRSYKNAVFAVKRQRLLDLDKSGIFVPLCTRNIFLKCYTPQADNLMFWSAKDSRAYKAEIVRVLVEFFTGNGESACE